MSEQRGRPARDFEMVDFGDKRLNKRLKESVENFTVDAQKSILGAGNKRSGAKAFYRLLSNERFNIQEMADAARSATIKRMGSTVLLIEDTTDINLKGHKKTEGLGYSSEHVRGVKVHSCIAVTPEGLPLGLVEQQYETRAEAKSGQTKAEKAARPIEEKESYRWIKMIDDSTIYLPESVHAITVCDREGDFYELYAKAREIQEDFVIRVSHDRSTETNEKVMSQIRRTKATGRVTMSIPRDSRKNIPAHQAEMEVAYCTVHVKKPKTANDPSLPASLTLNIVRITEADTDGTREPIEWILATSLPISNAEETLTVVEYYIQRWKIERFHFVLKSGCNAEKIQQRTYEKIKALILIYSVIAMFIMAVTYMGRVLPDTPCDVFFDTSEWQILYRIIHKTKTPPSQPYSMADAVSYLGELGSYKRAPSDGPPGLKSIWNGLLKLFEYMTLFMGQD